MVRETVQTEDRSRPRLSVENCRHDPVEVTRSLRQYHLSFRPLQV